MSGEMSSGWQARLDEIIEALETGRITDVSLDDLPKAAEIVRDPKNIAPLKEKLGELKKTVQDSPNPTDDILKKLSVFISDCRQTLDRWDCKLDAVIALKDVGKITVGDLPTAAEIVRDPKNIAPLKEKLKRLRPLVHWYFLWTLVHRYFPWIGKGAAMKTLTAFIAECDELLSWENRLDAVIAKNGGSEAITITLEELPTAAEITRDPKNAPLLKEKLESLKYLLLSGNLNDDNSCRLLESFIGNCERELRKAEPKKNSYEVPGRLQFNFVLVGLIWTAASVAPICLLSQKDFFSSRDYFYFEFRQAKKSCVKGNGRDRDPDRDRPGRQETPKKSAPAANAAPQSHAAAPASPDPSGRQETPKKPAPAADAAPQSLVVANWGAVLGFASVILIYVTFYAVLTLILLRTGKSLFLHHRCKFIHDDLSPLADLLAVRIDPNDTARLEARKSILKILMHDETGE